MRARHLPFLATALSAFLAISSSLPAAEPAAPPPAPAETVTLLADFQQKTPGIFSYASWQDRLGVSASGLVIQGGKGAQGNGGMGRTLETPLDLSRETYVELAIAVGVLNEVPEVTIALNDADKTQCSARVRINQLMPQQPVWLRVRLSDFKPVKGQDGSDGKMDWTQISQWHLQGDWSTKSPFHVLFIALRTRQLP